MKNVRASISRCWLFWVSTFLISAVPCSGQDLRSALERRLRGLLPSQGAALLWDIQRNHLIAGAEAERFSSPQCLGSIIKPFLVIAWMRNHANEFEMKPAGPALQPCVGRQTSQYPVTCWDKRGHGRLGLRDALALSCNQYFFQLASQTSAEAYVQTLARFNLSWDVSSIERTPSHPILSYEAMVGLDSYLRLIPLQVLQAYLVILQEAGLLGSLPGSFRGDEHLAASAIVDGLRFSAAKGTSVLAQKEISNYEKFLAKTGTAPSSSGGQHRRDRTDGWFLGFFPSERPTIAVMTFYPGGLGARDAAPLAGKVLRTYLYATR